MYENMYEKKRAPVGVYFLLLVISVFLGYYLSGLFIIPDLTLANLSEKILYIFLHPFTNWFNEKTPACVMIGCIVWIMAVVYVSYYYRNFQLAIEHGSSDWLSSVQASKELSDEDPKYNRILSQNLKVSIRGGLSNNNMLVTGISGGFKTTGLMHPNLLQFHSSYVVLDVKGDTQRKLGKAFLENGYTIRSLNLKDPRKSDRINPFVNIEREDDMLRGVKALQDSVRKPAKMTAADPFWNDGVRLYLQALFYYEWLDARERGETGSMNNVLRLVNLENRKMEDGETSMLQDLMDRKAAKYGDDYPPVRDYRKLKEGAPDTVRSIVIMVNAMLSICETAEVKRIFSGNDIDIRELGTGVGGDPSKKVVLFLIIPDNNSIYNFLISMFYTQMFDILIRLSDDELKAPLPVPVEFWMDEFYAGARPTDSDVLLGVVRSRNISMIPILQSFSQLKSVFKDNKWETIMDNVSAVVCLGTGPLASSTHKYISEALGKATIDSRDDNIHRGSYSNSGLSFKRTGRILMTEDEVKRVSPIHAIIFLESRPPIYDTKAIPFDKKEYHYKAPKHLKKRYMDALALGEYEHPVYTVYDAEHFHYITVDRDKPLKFYSGKEADRYRQAAKTDPHIYEYNLDETQLLYLSWGHPKREKEEIEKLFKECMEQEKYARENLKNLAVLQEMEAFDTKDFEKQAPDKTTWDKNASLKELLAWHWDQLSVPEQEEICFALDDGLTEEQIKCVLLLPLEQMAPYRRAYRMMNQAS